MLVILLRIYTTVLYIFDIVNLFFLRAILCEMCPPQPSLLMLTCILFMSFFCLLFLVQFCISFSIIYIHLQNSTI